MRNFKFRITGAYDASAGELFDGDKEDGIYCFGRVKGKMSPNKPARTSEFYTQVKEHPKCYLSQILNKISVSHEAVTGIKEDIINSLDKYNMKPPTGGIVERSRLEFYMNRAQLHRDFEPTFAQLEREFSGPKNDYNFHVTFNILAQNDISFAAERFQDLFEPDTDGIWMLKRDVYNHVILKVPKDSSPGYPYVAHGFSMNKDLLVNDPDDNDTLYGAVNDYLIMLITGELAKAIDSVKDLDHAEASRILYESGYVLPAMTFIKMEPTKKDKLARTIQGLCLISGLVTKIILGDYLFGLPDRWAEATHKVGLDFNTGEGKLKLAQHYASMHETVEYLNHVTGGDNFVVVTSDVQGYEWVARKMDALNFWRSLSECFLSISPFHAFLIEQLGNIDLFSTICIDSEGFVHALVHYILMSGKFVTHLQNSVTRAVQAIVYSGIEGDFEENMQMLCAELRKLSNKERSKGNAGLGLALNQRMFNTLCMTNGDDCANVQSRSTIRNDTITTIDFMKVTDVIVLQKNIIRFSSQMFVLTPEFWRFRSNPALSKFLVGDFVKRYPDSFMKAVLRVPEVAESQEATAGLMFHFAEHPGRVHLANLINEYNFKRGEGPVPTSEEARVLVKKVKLEDKSEQKDRFENFKAYTRKCYDSYEKDCEDAIVKPMNKIDWLKHSMEVKTIISTNDEEKKNAVGRLIQLFVTDKYKAAKAELCKTPEEVRRFVDIFDWVESQLE